MKMTKFDRKIRRLMVQGMSKKEATTRAAELLVKDYDEQARNAELVKLYHSKSLGMVSIPSS
jgi:uncharacterized protein YoaH (UPF0181 family)